MNRVAFIWGLPEIAGSYLGLRPWQLSGSVSEHAWERLDLTWRAGASDKTVLLGCDCGEPGCWPLMAEVAVRDREIVSRSFEPARQVVVRRPGGPHI